MTDESKLLRLREAEKVLRNAMVLEIKAGLALKKIRDNELYLDKAQGTPSPCRCAPTTCT